MTRIKSAWKRIAAVFLAMLTCAALIPSMAQSNLKQTAALADLPISQDMENNQILDALAYLGYDVAGAKAAGNLWNVDAEGVQAQYLCSRDPSLYIPYNDAGADGYNRLNGLPNVGLFRSTGLCCASFVTYVYFNYLEYVAGIDMSALRQSIANHGLYLRGNFAVDYFTVGEAWSQDGVARKLTASADENGYVTWYDQNGNVTTPAIGTIIIYENLVDAPRPDGGVNHKGDVHHVAIWLGEKDGVQYVAQMGDGTSSTTGLDYGPRIHNLANTTKLNSPMAIRCAYDTNTGIPQLGSLQIQKLSPEDGVVSGVTFNITGPNGFNITRETDGSGFITLNNITPGDYTVTELVGENYVPQNPQTVTVEPNETAYASVTFTNTLKKGSLTVTKTAEDGFVKDVTFRLTGTSSSGVVVDTTAVTDASGVATFNDIPTGNDFTLTEINTGSQYVVPAAQNVSIAWNEVTHASVDNPLKWGYVSGLKVDRETGNTIAGATFGIFAANETEFTAETSLREPVITGSDGKFAFHMPYGNYQIKELAPAPNYLPNDTIYQVSITENGQVIEITVTNDQVPEIGTEATVDGSKETHPFEQVTITDTVSYQHLIPGKEYTITGVLMDKATGEAFLVDGEEITSEVTFTPEEANGQVEAEFTFDASGITVNTDLVAFETLSQDGIELAVHADIEDEDQTVTVKVPEIGTVATVDGDKETHPFEQVTITDTVSYTNLIPGQEYTITGVLMDKATGEIFTVDGEEITSEVTFTPEEANGQVEAEFTFDASSITQDTQLVVFENLYQDGIELAVHANIDDEGQTVTVKVPDIHTTATVNGNKNAVKGGTVTIKDVVDYTGLIPGKEYTVTGVLMDKATGSPFLVNGEQITSEVAFTPETADGSVTVTFTFDTSAISTDTSLVVFEDLIQNGIELTTHADINDEAQTVTITVPAPVPQTGDNANLPIAMALGGLLLSLTAGGTIFFLLRRKGN